MGLGGDPLTRARFLWGATSSVEEIVSSMVSLRACLTGLIPFRRAGRLRRGFPRTHQGGAHVGE